MLASTTALHNLSFSSPEAGLTVSAPAVNGKTTVPGGGNAGRAKETPPLKPEITLISPVDRKLLSNAKVMEMYS
jgi:hypothetical protein